MTIIGDATTAYVATCVALFIKTAATSIFQGVMRVRGREFSAPEDARLMKVSARAESDGVRRLGAILRNDLENLPFFLFLATAYVLAGCSATGAWIYFPAFVAIRTLHSIAYWRAKQPLRFLCYAAGLLVCVTMAVHLVVAIALPADTTVKVR